MKLNDTMVSEILKIQRDRHERENFPEDPYIVTSVATEDRMLLPGSWSWVPMDVGLC